MLILLWNDVFACCTKAFAEVNPVCDLQKKINWTFFYKNALVDCGMRNSAGLQKYLISQAHNKVYLPVYLD